MNTLGNNIKIIIDDSQHGFYPIRKSRVAELVGIERKTLDSYIDGTTSPNAEKLVKLANALFTTPNRLLGVYTDEEIGLDETTLSRLKDIKKSDSVVGFDYSRR